MLRSKATAALMRLKEMDKKYNIKRTEIKRGKNNVSTESSLEDTLENRQTGFKTYNNNTFDSHQILKTTEPENEAKFEAVSLESKVPTSLAKNGNLLSNKYEPKSPEESLKIHVKVSISEDNTDVIEEKEESISTTKDLPKISPNSDFSFKEMDFIYKAKVDLEKPKSTDSLKKSDESSVTTITSKPSEASEIVSELIRSAEEELSSRKSERKSNLHKEIAAENSVQLLNANSIESTIEEITRISSEGSKITADLSHATDKGSSTDKSQSKDSSRKKQQARYESDTFEEASSSIDSSSSAEEQLEKTSEEEMAQSTIRSGVKQIMITPHKQTEELVQQTVSDTRSKEIIELVAPKIMQSTSECDIGLDEELSNYVRSTENVDEVLPISLLKLSKQTASTKRYFKKNKKHRKSSNENMEEMQVKETSSVTSQHETMEQNENKGKNNSSTAIKSSDQKDKRELSEEEEMSSPKKESKIENVEPEEVSKSEVYNVELQTISSEKILREIPKKSDVTCTLRKLNRDAIDVIARRCRIQARTETLNKSKQCKTCGTIVKLPSTEYESSEKVEANESRSVSLENVKKTTQDQRTKKRSKVRKVSKPSKGKRVSNRAKVEEKQSRFDCRQHRLRKQAAALKLQQEREDIRNYLLKLECTRLKLGAEEFIASSKVPSFKPLEFPKIATFVKPDPEETNLKSNDEVAVLQERVLMIRQWLKDQYILYRDYSNLVQTMNAKYVPASLEDAKRTIRQLQKATIKTR